MTYRGQLITADGRIDRSSLLAERSIIDAVPDRVDESLYCNLLPVESFPSTIYFAPITRRLLRNKTTGTVRIPGKSVLKDEIRLSQAEWEESQRFMPAFRVFEDKIVSFHDLEAPDGVFASVVNHEKAFIESTQDMLRADSDRNLVISLLNMALSRHARRMGLVPDHEKIGRFFFPPSGGGTENMYTWIPLKKKATRTVAKPCLGADGKPVFWRHQLHILKSSFSLIGFTFRLLRRGS